MGFILISKEEPMRYRGRSDWSQRISLCLANGESSL